MVGTLSDVGLWTYSKDRICKKSIRRANQLNLLQSLSDYDSRIATSKNEEHEG